MPATRLRLRLLRRAACLVLLLLLTGCASRPAPADLERSTVRLGGSTLAVQWVLPPGRPAALLVLEHGFARDCSHLRGTARQIAEQGLLVLCLDADMARGNPALADALGAALVQGLRGPDGSPLPRRLVVGGHSAGGLFAVHLGARLAALAPERLAGALLLDPVAGEGFAAQLQAISAGGRRPVLAVTAMPSACNGHANALPALRALPVDFAGLQFAAGSGHLDAEGEDSSWLAIAACGRPLPAAVALLRLLAARWAADIAGGSRSAAFYPGGALLDGLVAAGTARPIGTAAAAPAAAAVPLRQPASRSRVSGWRRM